MNETCLKCRVQWVCNDRACPGTEHAHVEAPLGGRATPDENEAVGYAVSFAGFATEFREGEGVVATETEGAALRKHALPICRDHLRRIPREGWVFLPFPAFLDEIVLDARLAEIKVVVEAVRTAFPRDAGQIESSLRGGSDHYSFVRWGMYVGVEADGYIHS